MNAKICWLEQLDNYSKKWKEIFHHIFLDFCILNVWTLENSSHCFDHKNMRVYATISTIYQFDDNEKFGIFTFQIEAHCKNYVLFRLLDYLSVVLV